MKLRVQEGEAASHAWAQHLYTLYTVQTDMSSDFQPTVIDSWKHYSQPAH